MLSPHCPETDEYPWICKASLISVFQPHPEASLKKTRKRQLRRLCCEHRAQSLDPMAPCLLLTQTSFDEKEMRGFPGGPVVKNPPANAGDTGSIPGLGRFHMPWDN